ncbi:MAG: N,N-dimethylformamidase beta subunit family domain-containing protein [Nocardioidaceae bacterium]
MLVGWVSDENFVALAGAMLEFQGADGTYEGRSSASGAVRVGLPAGDYDVALACAGYGSKLTRVRVADGEPVQFRLLRDQLLGYVWPKAARGGERCELRVSSPSAYRAELWRYGLTPEFVAHVGHGEHPPGGLRQALPDGDFVATGVGWSQVGLTIGPGVGASPRLLTAPDRSGLYFVHVHAEDGSVVTCPWVVAPPQPASDIAVLASDLTWNAYNSFGGRSNYVYAESLPPLPDVDRRVSMPRYRERGHEEWRSSTYPPLTFDRPEPGNQVAVGEQVTDPILRRDACALAAAEWRLLGWLEREGFGYDLYAESQLARGELDLSAYHVLMLNTHPEYWTVGMYERVKQWVREEGGRLVYLGGNGVNCAVELHDDTATMTVLNGDATELEPRRAEVESRFGLVHEPEAALLGVGYTRAGLLTAAPYEVVAPDHWVFAGTGVSAGDLVGDESLNTRIPGGASGHETDKRSPSSPPDLEVVARGTNPDGGGAEIATYSTSSGGAVFAAGSISFVTSLPIDRVLSQVVRNVLERFLTKQG